MVGADGPGKFLKLEPSRLAKTYSIFIKKIFEVFEKEFNFIGFFLCYLNKNGVQVTPVAAAPLFFLKRYHRERPLSLSLFYNLHHLPN